MAHPTAPDTPPAALIREKFANRIVSELAERNWSQSDLARHASEHLAKGQLSRDNVSNYCNAKALPGPAFLLAIAKALGTTSEDLLPERGQPAARDRGAQPSMDVQDMGSGTAFLRINKRVPWPVAVEILRIVNAVNDTDADDG